MCRSSFEENYLLFFEGKSLSLFNINQVSISMGKYLYFCGSAAALLTAIFIVNITLIISYKNSFIQILKITLRAGFQYFVSGRFYTEDALSSLRSSTLVPEVFLDFSSRKRSRANRCRKSRVYICNQTSYRI